MKDNKTIFTTFIIIILSCSIILAVIILGGSLNTGGKPPVSFPVDQEPDNLIDLEADKKKDFMFALITDDDTIELRNNLGEIVVINLDRLKWKDLQWAPDNDHISALGANEAGIYDLYLYSISEASWTKLTNYNLSNNGITSYAWASDINLLFTQGRNPDNWLHRLNIDSNEILKLNRVEGIIYSFSPLYTSLIENINGTFKLLDLDGTEIYSFEEFIISTEDHSEENQITAEEIYYSQEPDKIVIFDGENFYKNALGTSVVIELTNFNLNNLLCSTNLSEFIAYKRSDSLQITLLDTIQDSESIVLSSEINGDYEVINKYSGCYDEDNVLIKTELVDETTWLTIENNKLIEARFLKEANEVAVKTNIDK